MTINPSHFAQTPNNSAGAATDLSTLPGIGRPGGAASPLKALAHQETEALKPIHKLGAYQAGYAAGLRKVAGY